MIVYYFTCIASTLRAVRSKVRIPIGIRDFYVLQNFQTGSGTHPSSYFFPGQRSCRDVNLTTHLHFVQWLKWVELYFYSPICLHGAERENFTFLTSFTRILYDVSDFFLARSHEILGKYAQSFYNFNLQTISTCKNII
jgi:hypothetical protein